MGICLNPGSYAVEEAISSEIFVDKTEMIYYINRVVRTEQKYICVSRPRRFGKTMAARMLSAYYDRDADARALFEKCRISKLEGWDRYLGHFDVIRLVMTDYMKRETTVGEALNKLQLQVCRELKKAYPRITYSQEDDLLQSMKDIYADTRMQFVVIIDEWDSIFREYKADRDGQRVYLDFLRDWLKDKEYIALAYMTGILPVKKYGKHSALNMFDEYSMIQPMQLAQYTGFTKHEVKRLCEEYQLDYKEISSWYDGYRVSDWIPVNKRKL